MLQKALKVAFVALLAGGVSGCATMMDGTKQKVTVSPNVDDARVYKNGRLMGKGEVSFKAKRAWVFQEVPEIEVKKKGYETQTFELDTKFNKTAWVNVAFTSYSGPSWSTDAATGAVMEYEPSKYEVQLVKEDQASLTPKQQVKRFVMVNADEIKGDLAQGGGKHLQNLLDLASEADLSAKLQANKEDLLRADNSKVLSDEIVALLG